MRSALPLGLRIRLEAVDYRRSRDTRSPRAAALGRRVAAGELGADLVGVGQAELGVDDEGVPPVVAGLVGVTVGVAAGVSSDGRGQSRGG